MAVRSSTASDPRPPAAPAHAGSSPVRTCIGCRRRAPATELLRVVAVPESIGSSAGSSRAVPIVPDPRARAAGRGAWLHPEPGCVDLAERRRAFARALRVPAPVDPTAVRVYVAEAVPDEIPTQDRPKTAGVVRAMGTR